jgi:hypothetical protein
MLWLNQTLNHRLISQYTSRYQITWVGLFPDDLEAKQERQKLVLTVNEMREEDGRDEHPDPDVGNAPVNPVHMSIYSMKIQQKMMADQQAQMGGGDQGDSWHGLPDSESPLTNNYDASQPVAGKGGNLVGGKPAPKLLPAPAQAGPAESTGPAVKQPMAMAKAQGLAVTITRLGW